MASFFAFLDVKGQQYPLLSYDLSIHQETDSLGRPASPTLGGTIDCVLSAPGSDKSFLHQWMFSPTLQEDGRLILLQDSPRATLKTISFFNAYCTGLETRFVPGDTGGGSLQLLLRISPQRIAVGVIVHDNNWPLESHGAGQSFAEQSVAPIARGKASSNDEPSAFSEGLHGVLDVVGMIPVIGEVADAANAAIYLAQGDYANAAMSAASMIPLAGNVVGAAKLAKTGMKLTDRLGGVAALGKKAIGKLDDAFETVKGPLERLRKKCGDPVDVASGDVIVEAIDFTIAGPIPLVWRRIWFSSATRNGAVGQGWTHSYEWAIIAIAQDRAVGIRDGEGRLHMFEAPTPGGAGVQSEQIVLFLDRDGSYRLWHYEERRWYHFGAAKFGQDTPQPLQFIADPNGFTIRFAYTKEGNLRSITDCADRLFTVDTTENGQITAIYSPQSDDGSMLFPLISYQHDVAGRLVSATDAQQQIMRYDYTGSQLTRRTTRNGVNWYYTYETETAGARCTHAWGEGDLLDYTLQYDTETQTTTRDSYQNATIYTHRNGLVTRQVDSLGGEQLWTYDEHNLLTAYRDELGHVTRYMYNEWGQLTETLYADGTALSYRYDDRNLLTSKRDAKGAEWQWRFDERGNLLTSTNPTGLVTKYEYDNLSRLTQVTGPVSRPIRYRYDGQHNLAHIILVGVTPDDEQITSRSYDSLGRVITITDPSGASEQRTYDRIGRLIQQVDVDGTIRTMAYDPSDNLIEVRENDTVVRMAYSALGKPVARQQHEQQTIFNYDLEGRLTGFTNEAGQAYLLEVNKLGQVVKEVGFDGIQRTYERDAAGRIVKLYRPDNRTTEYVRDSMGRISRVVYGDGFVELFEYDETGALVRATNTNRTVKFERDLLGNVISETQGDQVVMHEFDQFGQRMSMSSSLGASVQYDRTEDGIVSAMRAGDWNASFTHDKRGNEVERRLGSSISVHTSHDWFGRLQQEEINQPDTSRVRTYQWTGNGLLTQLLDTHSGDVSYTHDRFGGLEQAVYSDGTIVHRITDEIGNVFEEKTLQDRTYNASGAIVERANTAYNYDAEGNLSEKREADGSIWKYTWNQAGQLTDIVRPDKQVVTFKYDALGRRISKSYNDVTVNWIWNDNVILHEWSDGETPNRDSSEDVVTWLFEDESVKPIAKQVAQHTYSVLTDHIGTPISLYDENGAESWSGLTDIYGRFKGRTGEETDCLFRFPGQYEDVETGLYYNRFRYYSPQDGQYISQDPVRYVASLRFYSYVKDSTRYVDILGWEDIWFRALRPQDLTTIGSGGGIIPKNPTATNTPMEHVLHGSTPGYGDQYTSLTKERKMAENWARRNGMDVAEIDLDKVPNNKLDLSTADGRLQHLGDVSRAAPGTDLHQANKLAKGAKELLVEGKIPQDAINSVYTPCQK